MKRYRGTHEGKMPSTAIRFATCLVAILAIVPCSRAQPAFPAASAENSSAPPAIVFGFVGGFVRHNDIVHSVVQLAARLHQEFPSNTIVEVFENRNGENAYRRIRTLLDTNRDGTLSVEEKRAARIIFYGHSWGASECIFLAHRLGTEGIPVLLTVQVDSVAKLGQNDEVIPANVAQAVNFYQADGLLHGDPTIRAADPARTRILGNFRFSYAAKPYNCIAYPWYARIFMKAHTQIECDPKVWGQVESLIRSALHASAKTPPAR